MSSPFTRKVTPDALEAYSSIQAKEDGEVASVIIDIMIEAWGSVRTFGGWVLGLTYICLVASVFISADAGQYLSCGMAVVVAVAVWSVRFRIDDLRSREDLRMQIAETGKRLSDWKLLSRAVRVFLIMNLLVSGVVTALLIGEDKTYLVYALQVTQVAALLLCRWKLVLTVPPKLLASHARTAAVVRD